MSDTTPEQLQPAITVETPQEQRLDSLTPDKRAELTRKSEELRRAATDIEARKQEAVAEQARDEAAAAGTQERINAVLGTHNILDTVRNEDAALIAIFTKQQENVNKQLSAIEAKLNSPVSAPNVAPPSSEATVMETSKSLTPDLTAETPAQQPTP